MASLEVLTSLPISSVSNIDIEPTSDEKNISSSVGYVSDSSNSYAKNYTIRGLDSPLSGSTSQTNPCKTCGEVAPVCTGHSIILRTPPFINSHYIKELELILNIFCAECGHLYLSPLTEPLDKSKTFLQCLEKYLILINSSFNRNTKKVECSKCKWVRILYSVNASGDSLIYHRNNEVIERVTLAKIKDHIQKIDLDTYFHIFGDNVPFPGDFITETISVPPYNQRQTSQSTTGLTMVSGISIRLRHINGFDPSHDSELNAFISSINAYIKNQKVEIKSKHIPVHENIGENAGGRHGTVRTGLSKNTTNVIRGVAISDIDIKIGEIGISKKTLNNLTLYETYNNFNSERLLKLQKEGKLQAILLPGITEPITDQEIIKTTNLKATEGIWSPPIFGSTILITRYPSISVTSNIAVTLVEIDDERDFVFAINPMAFAIFQLGDFDGDTITGNGLKTIFDQYSAKKTSSCLKYIYSATNGSFQLTLPVNNVYGLFLLTRYFEEVPLTKDQSYFIANGYPSIIKKLDAWFKKGKEGISGRRFFQFLIGEEFCFQKKTCWYNSEWQKFFKYQEGDDLLVIKNGLMLQGVLDVEVINGRGPDGFLSTLFKTFSEQEVIKTLSIFENVSMQVNLLRPFSTNIFNYDISEETLEKIDEMCQNTISNVKETEFKKEKKLISPEMAEHLILLQLGQVNNLAEDILSDPRINKENSMFEFLMMANKMMILMTIFLPVGQMLNNNKRSPLDEYGRTNIFWANGDYNPIAFGWIESSRRKGLSFQESFNEAPIARQSISLRTHGTRIAGTISRHLLMMLSGLKSLRFGTICEGSANHALTPIANQFSSNNILPNQSRSVKVSFLYLSDLEWKEYCQSWPEPYQKFLQVPRYLSNERAKNLEIISKLRHNSVPNYYLHIAKPLEHTLRSVKRNKNHDYTEINIQTFEEVFPELIWFNVNIGAMGKFFISGTRFEECDETQKLLTAEWLSYLITTIKSDDLKECLPEEFRNFIYFAKLQQYKEQVEPGYNIGALLAMVAAEKITQKFLDAPKEMSGSSIINTTTKKMNSILKVNHAPDEPVLITGHLSSSIKNKKAAETLLKAIETVLFEDIFERIDITFSDNLSPMVQDLINLNEIIEETAILNLVLIGKPVIHNLIDFDPYEVIMRLEKEFPNLIFCFVPDQKNKLQLIILFKETLDNKTFLHNKEIDVLSVLIEKLKKTVIKGLSHFIKSRVFPSHIFTVEKGKLVEHQTLAFEIEGTSILPLFKIDGISNESLLSGSTWLNLKELGPVRAIMGIKIHGEYIMEGVDYSYLDLLSVVLIQGSNFFPISSKGANTLLKNSMLTRSQMVNAEQVINDIAHGTRRAELKNPLDSFIFGQDPLMGSNNSAVEWRINEEENF